MRPRRLIPFAFLAGSVALSATGHVVLGVLCAVYVAVVIAGAQAVIWTYSRAFKVLSESERGKIVDAIAHRTS